MNTRFAVVPVAAMLAAMLAPMLACFTWACTTTAPGALDAGAPGPSPAPAPHYGGVQPYPVGTGVQAVSGGLPLTAAITGDAGFLLTSNGTSSLPTYQPAPSTALGRDLFGATSDAAVVSASGTGVNSATDAGTAFAVAATEVILAAGSRYPTRVIQSAFSTSDTTTWVSAYVVTPTLDQNSAWWLDCVAGEMSVDAGGVGLPNVKGDHVAFNLQFTFDYSTSNGFRFVANQGLQGPSSQVTLTPLNPTGSLDGGPLLTPPNIGARAGIVDAGADAMAATQMQVQFTGPAASLWEYTCTAERVERR